MTPFFTRLLKLNFIIINLLTVLLAPPAAAGEAVRARWLMGTLCEATAYGKHAGAAVSAAFAEIARIEAVLTTFNSSSEVAQLNRNPGVWRRTSETLWEVLRLSREMHSATGGAFDPTYGSDAGARGFSKIHFDAKNRRIKLPVGGNLNFGAIGKGYALDRALVVLKEHGVDAALINFGGQIIVLGLPRDGSVWPVEIVAPSCAGSAAAAAPCRIITARLERGSAATSGLSERPGHIRNPTSGRPVRRAGAVTVLAPTAAEADAWSTALFVDPTLASPHCAIDFRNATIRHLGDCRPYRLQETRHDS